MIVFGLTGGVGMGKSTAARFLGERGFSTIDTDMLARDVVEPGKPALDEIRDAFGPDVIDPAGHLRRDELARRVFDNPEARLRLEGILHPRIRKRWLAEVERWRSSGVERGAVVIPLLFETNATAHFTHTVCIACTPASQRARLQERGWSAAEIDRRIAAQLPIEKKMLLADFIVWSEGPVELLAIQFDRIIAACSTKGPSRTTPAENAAGD